MLLCYPQYLWCGLSSLETLPENILYGHFRLLAFPFHFNINVLRRLIPSLCQDKAKVICMYGKQSGGAVALAYKFLYSTRQRKREGFWSCVPSADIIFVMQLLQTMKQSWPSKKIRVFMKWEERDNYKAWNLKALLQKLKVCVSFHYGVFSFFFFYTYWKRSKYYSLIINIFWSDI